ERVRRVSLGGRSTRSAAGPCGRTRSTPSRCDRWPYTGGEGGQDHHPDHSNYLRDRRGPGDNRPRHQLNRPSGNVTGGVFFASGQLGTKRMELLCEMVPKAAIIAVLMDPKFATQLAAVERAGRALGRQILMVNAASERELDAAFSQIVHAGAGALLVGGSPFF